MQLSSVKLTPHSGVCLRGVRRDAVSVLRFSSTSPPPSSPLISISHSSCDTPLTPDPFTAHRTEQIDRSTTFTFAHVEL